MQDRRTVPAEARFTYWTAPDGWRIRQLHWPRAGSGRARGTLLFAGGRGDFIEKYLEAQRHWAERGWRVIAIDWRGQGQSRGDSVGGHLTDFAPLAADLAGMIKAWQAKEDGPLVLIGHSMGGHLVLRTLIEHHPDVAAAVLVAPMIDVNSAPLPRWAAAHIAALMAAIGAGRRPLQSRSFGAAPTGSARQRILTSCPERYEDELWWWKREPGLMLGAPSWGWLDAAYRSAAAFLTPKRLAEVTVPVLLIGTERDRLVRASAIAKTAAALPNGQLLMFEDAGHEILREADGVRAQALARIDAFLDQT